MTVNSLQFYQLIQFNNQLSNKRICSIERTGPFLFTQNRQNQTLRQGKDF